ncbi:4581_t:CDS:2, partial [Acaulospora colombiana]
VQSDWHPGRGLPWRGGWGVPLNNQFDSRKNMKPIYSLTALAATVLSTVKAQQSNYGQCGGIGWTGTCLVEAAEFKSAYFFQ